MTQYATIKVANQGRWSGNESVQRNVVLRLACLVGVGQLVVAIRDPADARLQPLALRLGQSPHQPADRETFPIGVLGIVAAGVEREDLFQDLQVVRNGEA